MIKEMEREDSDPHYSDLRAALIVLVITALAMLAASTVRALADGDAGPLVAKSSWIRTLPRSGSATVPPLPVRWASS